MAHSEIQLQVKRSVITGAGKGLFTKKMIKKGSLIVEYTGTVTSWKEADHVNFTNGYIYYVNRNHVIDARKHTKSLGRYVNDANGLERTPGFCNNAQYVKEKGKIYLQATADIPAGEEILVSYGKEYWDVIKRNRELDEEGLGYS